MKCLLTFLMSVLFVHISNAQFQLQAEVRPRSEFRHGFKTPLERDHTPAIFTEQRTRLISTYTSDKVELGLSIQDVRIWGSVDQIYKSDSALTSLNQAWMALKFNTYNKIIVGRQILDYDNARILGNLEWAQQGRSHDLFRYIFEKKEWSVHLGLAFNQDSNTSEPVKLSNTYYSGVNNYKTLQYSWVKRASEKSSVSLLILNQGIQVVPDTVNYNQSIGLNFSHRIGKYDVHTEFHYQMGKNRNYRKVKGFLASLSIDRKFDKISTTLGVDWLSGDNPDTRAYESFTPWYGTNHKFYGLMDYFYVGNGHRSTGLINPYIKGEITLSDRTGLLVHLHHFSADTKISSLNNKDSVKGNALGGEYDIVFTHNLSSDVNLKIGYSQLFFTPAMELIKNSTGPRKTAVWVWAMLTFKPVLIK